MKKLKKLFSQKLLRTSSSIAIGAALLGITTNADSIKASSPALCKDKLTQTTLKQNISAIKAFKMKIFHREPKQR